MQPVWLGDQQCLATEVVWLVAIPIVSEAAGDHSSHPSDPEVSAGTAHHQLTHWNRHQAQNPVQSGSILISSTGIQKTQNLRTVKGKIIQGIATDSHMRSPMLALVFYLTVLLSKVESSTAKNPKFKQAQISQRYHSVKGDITPDWVPETQLLRILANILVKW